MRSIIKMKKIFVIRLIFFCSIGSISIANAQDDDTFKTVERMTKIICDNYQASGSVDESKIKGMVEAEAELSILSMELAAGGVEGAVELFSNSYFGLRQDDLAAERLSVRSCKLSVWSDIVKLREDKENKLTEASDLEPEKYMLDIKRPLRILDGEAKIELSKISMQGPFKIAGLNIEAPNRPVQTIYSSPKSRNFPNFQEFEYRNINYTIDIKEIFIEDQRVALHIYEAE